MTLLMEIAKILFEKCKIGVILRSHESHILIKLVQQHWVFFALNMNIFGILEVRISVTTKWRLRQHIVFKFKIYTHAVDINLHSSCFRFRTLEQNRISLKTDAYAD